MQTARNILLIDFAAMILCEIAIIYMKLTTPEPLARDLFRCAVTVALFAALWNGYVWAKWVFVALTTLAGTVTLFVALNLIGKTEMMELGVLSFAAAAIYLSAAIVCLLPPGEHFLEHQRYKRLQKNRNQRPVRPNQGPN